jgi:hypothetical protein
MTEQEWLACTDSHPMLDFLAGRFVGALFADGFETGDWSARLLRQPDSGRGDWQNRKFCLFNVACCRRVWRWLTEEVSRNAVEVAERFADGLATEEERQAAFTAAGRVVGRDAMHSAWADRETSPDRWMALEVGGAAHVAAACHRCDDWYFYGGCARITARGLGARSERDAFAERAAQAGLLRDLFGDLFRPATIDPSWFEWNGRAVPEMAEVVYDERSFPEGLLDKARLAVLADALEEAGCTEADLLGHLRGPGAHTRGCWAVDVILGRG